MSRTVLLVLALLPACRGAEPVRPTPRADAAAPAPAAPPGRVEVAIPSGELTLRGWLIKPAGDGPFPAVVYNHGSEQSLDIANFADLAGWWQAHGYVVVFPCRRGVGGSPGRYWKDVTGEPETEDGQRAAVVQLDVDNADVVAALAWTRAQPFVDPRRIAVAGCSFGGIHTLLAAEKETAARAAIDFAGASITWATWEPMRERMKRAARAARIPVFFLQAENDFDTTPSKALSDEMTAAGKPTRVHIYPPFGKSKMAGHGGFCLRGMRSWGDDALEFLAGAFAAP